MKCYRSVLHGFKISCHIKEEKVDCIWEYGAEKSIWTKGAIKWGAS